MHVTKFLSVTSKDSANILSIGLIISYKESLFNNEHHCSIRIIHQSSPNVRQYFLKIVYPQNTNAIIFWRSFTSILDYEENIRSYPKSISWQRTSIPYAYFKRRAEKFGRSQGGEPQNKSEGTAGVLNRPIPR